jgi:hypothetical protein
VAIYSAASGNLIGQTTTDFSGTIHHFYGNRICGNTRAGVHLYDTSTAANVVQDNYIGVYVDANNQTQILPNAVGVDFSGGVGGTDLRATANVIGTLTYNPDGTPIDPAKIVPSPNFISGNLTYGIRLRDSDTAFNVIQGNFIGTDVGGTQSLDDSSQLNGVLITRGASNNLIGGTALDAHIVPVNVSRNLIAGNDGDGIAVDGGSNNVIQGNFIGIDKTGFAPLSNGGDGISLSGGTNNNLIGGTVAFLGVNQSSNLIGANLGNGISILGATTSGNLVQGNNIGTDLTGTALITNRASGILISGGANDNAVGGLSPFAGNVIGRNADDEYPGTDGVLVDGGTGNSVRGNSIFGHFNGLGIELINGGNDNQTSPTLRQVTSNGSDTVIRGVLPSTPDTAFALEFFRNTVCDPSGSGEGEEFLGSALVTTDDNGRAFFVVDLGVAVPVGEYVTATATSPGNDTSQFSNCQVVTNDTAVQLIPVGHGIIGLDAGFLTGGTSAVQPPVGPGLVMPQPVEVDRYFKALSDLVRAPVSSQPKSIGAGRARTRPPSESLSDDLRTEEPLSGPMASPYG